MRSDAKASSVGSTLRQGKSLGRIVRGALATRGASLSRPDGSGALSTGRLATLLSVLAATAGLIALSAPGASAAGFHPFLETFGSAAQPSFTSARGIAIYQATGDVYVMDAGSPASIKRYNADGTPDNFSALGSNVIDGQGTGDETPQNGLGFGSPSESQIAIDNSGGATDGNIYVTQSFPNLINVFSSTGAYLGQLTAAGATDFTEACGVAVDPTGAVYVGDYGSGIHKFVPAANPPVNADHTATFTTTSNPCTLAAGAGATAGFLFPAEYNGPISKIDSSTGEAKYTFSSGVTTVSVDPATGHVYAAKGSEFTEFDASGAGSASTVASETLGSQGFGIAVRGSSGNVYASRFNAANLKVFGPLKFAPTVAIEPASGVTATEATLNGTVDPEGVALSECKFEWSPTSGGGYPNSAPCEQSVPADSNVHAVSADITGLIAGGTQYHFRLVAKNADATATSDPETFRVGATINGTAATVGTDEATLHGAIIPGGQGTGYHFEWGTGTGYGNSTPAGNLPAGNSPVAVSADLSGLTPGTTYHYRLVATNGTGTTEGPDQTFTPTAPPQLPQRGYEIASQYPTGGVPIIEITGRQVPSEDGTEIEITATNPLPHSTLPPLPGAANGSLLQYLFSRGSDSWQHRTEIGFARPGGWSANLERFLLTTRAQALGSGSFYEDPRVDPDDRNDSFDVYQRQPDGSLTWISRDPRIPVGTPQTPGPGEAAEANQVYAFTMSADGRTVVFKSNRQLLDADTTSVGEAFRLYKWEDGQLSFIGVRPDGSVPANGSSLGAFSTYARYMVSRDGNRVIFYVNRGDDGTQSFPYASRGSALYVQTDGQPTVEASKEEGVPPLPASQLYNVTYGGAAEEDSRVFFTSASRLTPDSGAGASDGGAADLYAYDVETDTLRDLTPRLDGLEDPSVDPASADSADVLGVAANSADGKRVYFVANGRYPTAPNPEGDLPSASGRNLYMAELDGIEDPIELSFVATLRTEDRGNWSPSWKATKTSLASPDGSVLGFRSTESLTGQPLGGTGQLFVYDADRGTLACPSCPTDGSLPTKNVNERADIVVDLIQEDWQGDTGVRRWVSSDGTVFFTTATALLPADQNLANDVYEFHDGKLGLVSSGTPGAADSVLSNASVDGSTVFFNTQAALVPQDKEPGTSKIYAARVGGGFPYVAPPPPCDFNAGACEGAPSTVPQSTGAGTAAFEGPGDPKPGSKQACPKGKRKVRAKGKTRCVTKHHHKRTAKNNRRVGR